MFRRLFPLCAPLLLFAGVSRAQPLPDRAPIRGQVVDEAGRPISSAVVSLRRQDETAPTAFWGAEARADATGLFVIPHAEVGRYFLSVEAAGFASLSSVALDWKRQSAPARLQLLRLTKLSLRVVSPDGMPLTSAPLWIRLRNAEGIQTLKRAQTGARGEVEVRDIAPASYSVVLVAQSGIWTQSALGVSKPGAPVEARLREGTTLRIKARTDGKSAGGAALILFPQNPEEAVRLDGEGADPGENWALLSQANAPQATVTREGDGTLEVRHLPPGRYSARLSLPDHETQPRDFTLEEGKTLEWNADFASRRMATLSLRVVDARGQIVSHALVAFRLLPLAANGAFENEQAEITDPNAPPDVPTTSFGFAPRAGRTDSEGKVTLFPVRAGRFRVFASRPANDSWLRAPVAPEGAPTDIVLSLNTPNTADVQVP